MDCFRLLKFNIPKCKALHFCTENDRQPHRMDSIPIDKETSEEDRVVLFTNRLKCQHTDKIVSKVNSMLGLIERIFQHWAIESFNAVYRTCIRTHL